MPYPNIGDTVLFFSRKTEIGRKNSTAQIENA